MDKIQLWVRQVVEACGLVGDAGHTGYIAGCGGRAAVSENTGAYRVATYEEDGGEVGRRHFQSQSADDGV